MYIHVELYNLVRVEASGTSARVGDRDRGWVGGSWVLCYCVSGHRASVAYVLTVS